MSLFIDTSAVFAVLDAEDRNHEAAARIWTELLSPGDDAPALEITSYVLVETFALVQRRLGREAVRALVDDVVPLLRTCWVDKALHERGVAAVLAAGGALGLVDCVSFEYMRSRGIRRCFAFDTHFEKWGFEPLS